MNTNFYDLTMPDGLRVLRAERILNHARNEYKKKRGEQFALIMSNIRKEAA